MAAPEKVRLKRKRDDDPLEALILSRAAAGNGEVTEGGSQKRIRYKLVENQTSSDTSGISGKGTTTSTPSRRSIRRLFHLRRVPKAISSDRHISDNGATRSIPTFEERNASARGDESYEEPMDVDGLVGEPVVPHKRPGKGSSLGYKQDTMRDMAARKATLAAEHRQNMQDIADLLHEATLEELAKIPKPSTHAKPKLSSRQAKERHDRNVASRGGSPESEDAQKTGAAEFVYDTYVLVPTDDVEDSAEANIGYLVIGKDDEEFWQSFMDDQDQNEEQEKDEDDENAENYYAADYPEDEDETDEDFRGEHDHMTRNNENDEEWDHRNENSDELDLAHSATGSVRNAKVVREWEKILYGDDV